MPSGYDIGAGISSAFDLSDKFDTRQQQSIGPIIHNVGSAAKVTLTDAGQSMTGDTDQTSKTDSVASNAKAGDKGTAMSTAQLDDAGIQKGGLGAFLGGMSSTTKLALAAGAAAALLIGAAVFLKKRKAKP